MKSSQVALFVIGFILLALMATNPSIEDHRQAVMENLKEKIAESSNSDYKNEWQKAGEAIGMTIGSGIVEKAVSRENYLVFSLTRISIGKNIKNIGFGCLGKVWIGSDYEDFNNKISESNNEYVNNKISESNNQETINFQKYPSGPIGSNKTVKINKSSNKNALGQLEYGIEKGYHPRYKIDFASYYEIFTYGVGTGCSQGVMIDLRDGTVYSLPINCPACFEGTDDEYYNFKKNSLLFINTYCPNQSAPDDGVKKTDQYLWSEETKKFIKINGSRQLKRL